MRKILRSFLRNFATSFSGKRSMFHIVAIVGTYICVISGFDWFYFTHTQSSHVQNVLFPAVVIGGILPMVLPIVLLLTGWLWKNRKILWTSYALIQSVLLGSLISSLYKGFTGRIQPDRLNTLIDSSHSFNFGFFEHGVFWGWPSSHTTIAFAMAGALAILYKKNSTIRYGVFLYALYVGIGVSVSIHWFSEFFAGALIGSAIGIAVGTSFLATLKSVEKSTERE